MNTFNKLFGLVLLFCLGQNYLFAQTTTWQPVGADGDNVPVIRGYLQSLAGDKLGGIYLANTQHVLVPGNNNTYKVSVRYWDGQSWEQVGQPGFSVGAAGDMKIVMAPDSVPYVVYRDVGLGGKVIVKYLNNNNWIDLGNPVSSGDAKFPSIAIDDNGIPYIAYLDSVNSLSGAYRLKVKKWNGSVWQSLTDTTTTMVKTEINKFKFSVSGDGVPYLFVEYSATLGLGCKVFKYLGSTWNSLGSPCPWNSVGNFDITIDNNNVAYIGYSGFVFGPQGLFIKKYNGTNWVNVDTAVTTGHVYSFQLSIDSSNIPYVIYKPETGPPPALANAAVVSRFVNATWEIVGSPVAAGEFPPALAFDANNVPYIMYQDPSMYGDEVLRKLVGNTWQLQGDNAGFTNAASNLAQIARGQDGSSLYCLSSSQFVGNLGRGEVFKFDDTVWTSIGFPGADTSNNAPMIVSIAMHPNGYPWIITTDGPDLSNQEATAWRFDGVAWIYEGSLGAVFNSKTPSIVISSQGIPYATQYNIGGILTIKKYESGNWVTFTNSPWPQQSSVSNIEFKLDKNDVPHISAAGYGSGGIYAFEVYKYDPTASNNWVSRTGNINSAAGSSGGSIPNYAFDSTNALYVCYLNGPYIKVRKYNSIFSFSDIIAPNSDTLKGLKPRIQFAEDGSLYIVYDNFNITSSLTGISVSKLVGNQWQAVGNQKFSNRDVNYLDLAILNNKFVTAYINAALFSHQLECNQPVAIIQQVEDTVVCSGDNASFSIIANNVVKYRWQFKDTSGWKNVPFSAAYSGNTDPILTISSVHMMQHNNEYRCVMTNSCGGLVISKAAKLLLDTLVAATPSIMISANTLAACSGNPVTFSAVTLNEGNQPIYEWRINGVVSLSGPDTFFSTSALTAADVVSCKLYKISACTALVDTAISNTINISIAPLASPSVTVAASPGTIINQGEVVNFSSVVTNGGAVPSFQWTINNNNIPGATSSNFSTSNLANGDKVSVKVTRNDTCSNPHIAFAPSITMEVATGIKNGTKQDGLYIYPQPASDYLILSFEKEIPAGEYNISMTNNLGQVIFKKQLKTSYALKNYKLLPESYWPSGIYFLRIINDNYHFSSKVLIMR